MSNDEQQDFWEKLAPEWIRAQEDLESIGGWFGDRAIEVAAVVPGEQVVDIGCGTGETTVALARAAAPAGRAVGVDISAAMVTEAQRRATAAGVDNVSYAVADAQETSVATDVDVVFSRFGVMFFSDPVAAFANLRAGLRDGGRLVVVVWQSVFANEWMLVSGMAALTVTGALPPMPAEGEPGPFSLADPDHLRAVLTDAGFAEVDVAPLEHELVVPRDGVDDFVRRSMAVGAAREAVRASGDDPAVAAAVADQLRRDVLARIGDGDATTLTAAAWLATARR